MRDVVCDIIMSEHSFIRDKMPKEQDIKTLYTKSLEKMDNLTTKQKKILEVSLELFATQGFEATTSAQIAEKAEVSAGSVYHHFQNKKELLIAVLTPLFSMSMQTVADEFISSAFEQKFLTLDDFIITTVTDRMTFIYDNIQELRLMFEQLLTNKSFGDQIKKIMGEQIIKAVIPTIEYFKNKKEIIDLPNETICSFMFGPIIAYFGKLVLDIDFYVLDKEIQYTSQLLIRALHP